MRLHEPCGACGQGAMPGDGGRAASVQVQRHTTPGAVCLELYLFLGNTRLERPLFYEPRTELTQAAVYTLPTLNV